MSGEEIMSREAMQIALDALEANLGNWAAKTKAVEVLRQALGAEQKTAVSPGKGTGFNYFRASAITVLRQAQEPVAWASSLDFDDDDQEIIPAKDKGKLGTSNCDIPLYTAPKQWVGLTEREVELIDEMIETQLLHAERCDHMANSTMAQKQKAWDLERVELLRKLKEKNT